MQKQVGLIGIGLLGTALARRLLAGGFDLVGFDLDPERMKAFEALGGASATSVTEIAQSCGRIVFCLPTSAIAWEVVEQMSSCLHSGTIILDTTTGHPAEMEQIASLVEANQGRYFDTTVCGSSEQAGRGEAVILAGGTEQELASARDVLSELSEQIFFLGRRADAARMKLVVNLVLGLNRAVLAEGLSFARQIGLSESLALQVLRAGPASSVVMKTKGEKMVHREFSPQARLIQHRKDVELILEQGIEAGAFLPLTTVHRKLLDSLIDAGCGNQDNSVILNAFLQEPAD